MEVNYSLAPIPEPEYGEGLIHRMDDPNLEPEENPVLNTTYWAAVIDEQIGFATQDIVNAITVNDCNIAEANLALWKERKARLEELLNP